MPKRRNLILTASALASVFIAGHVFADDTTATDYLLVQTAKGLAFDKATNTLSLIGVSPITLFFADRPERIAGNMKTTAFVPFWSQGKDSFAKDPPNADVSIIEGDAMRQVVVVLQDPILDGDTLRYTIKTVQGEMPEKGSRRVGLHRHHRHATNADVVRRCGPKVISPRMVPLTPSRPRILCCCPSQERRQNQVQNRGRPKQDAS